MSNYSSAFNLLEKPLTDSELKKLAGTSGRISVNIAVSLDELIGLDINGLNDLADELILNFGGSLSDLWYEVVAAIPADRKTAGTLRGTLILKINADVSDLI
jgi:hypothetical protein